MSNAPIRRMADLRFGKIPADFLIQGLESICFTETLAVLFRQMQDRRRVFKAGFTARLLLNQVLVAYETKAPKAMAIPCWHRCQVTPCKCLRMARTNPPWSSDTIRSTPRIRGTRSVMMPTRDVNWCG
jgi:hypothetical protein